MSLVFDLQEYSTDPSIDIETLLRKSFVVAYKLDVSEFLKWIEKETSGYQLNCDEEEVPTYRTVRVVAQFYDHSRKKWRILSPRNSEERKILNEVIIILSASDIEHAIKNNKQDIYLSCSSDVSNYVYNNFKYTQCRFQLSSSEARKLLNEIKNVILRWSLRLERENINGEGMRFSLKEKEQASQHSYTNIINNIQNLNNSPIQQGNSNSKQQIVSTTNQYNLEDIKELLELIDSSVDRFKLNADEKQETTNEIQTIKEEVESDLPNSTKIHAALSSIKRILEGTASGVSARGVIYAISEFLS